MFIDAYVLWSLGIGLDIPTDESESVTSSIHEYDEVSESDSVPGDEGSRNHVRGQILVYYKVARHDEYSPMTTYEIPPQELAR